VGYLSLCNDTTKSISINHSLKALFDPGSDLTFLHQRCLPAGATRLLSKTRGDTTLAGTFNTKRFVTMYNIILPEFHGQNCLIFDTEWPYDIILGQYFLTKIGMDINFNGLMLTAFGNTVAIRFQHSTR
jgi:hypothetical protein